MISGWGFCTDLSIEHGSCVRNLGVEFNRGQPLRPPSGSVVKNLPAIASRHRFDLWVGKVPWRKKWLPTPVFLPGESCG